MGRLILSSQAAILLVLSASVLLRASVKPVLKISCSLAQPVMNPASLKTPSSKRTTESVTLVIKLVLSAQAPVSISVRAATSLTT